MSGQGESTLPELASKPSSDELPAERDQKERAADWFAGVPRSAGRATLSGYVLLVAGMTTLGAWGAAAPLDGAIVAPGVFVATGQNKVIQHLEGGIIREIRVREGELVEKDHALVVLDDTAVNAEVRRLRLKEFQLLAQEERLKAEEGLKDELVLKLSDRISDLDADEKAIVQNQRAMFEARRRKSENEVSILRQTIESLRSREKGDQERLKAVKEQLALIEEELRGKQNLVDRGLVRLPEYYAVRRAQSNATGQVGDLTAAIQDSREKIQSTHHQIERVRNVYIQSAVEERLSIGAEIKDVRERLVAARSIIDRLVIRAPVRGIVVKLNYNTSGGVIRPGNDILALLPLGDDLIIEARVKPQDIDNLRKDQIASVRLTALSQRVTPIVQGHVIYVSADAIPNDARGTSADNIYVARIKLDEGEAARVPNFLPTPGMPAEIFIKTGQRTFLEYLMRPIYDTMARAFREA